MGWFRKRGSEPSTWAGFAAMAQILKTFFPEYAIVADIITGAAGSAAVAVSEQSSPPVAPK